MFYSEYWEQIAMETANIPVKRIEIIKNEDDSKTYSTVNLLERSFEEKHYLLPIPRTEIERSGGSLTQNPDYD